MSSNCRKSRKIPLRPEKECDLSICTVVDSFAVKYFSILVSISILTLTDILSSFLSILETCLQTQSLRFSKLYNLFPYLTTVKVSGSSLKSASAETIGSSSYLSDIEETLYKILEGSTFKISSVGYFFMILRKLKKT